MKAYTMGDPSKGYTSGGGLNAHLDVVQTDAMSGVPIFSIHKVDSGDDTERDIKKSVNKSQNVISVTRIRDTEENGNSSVHSTS